MVNQTNLRKKQNLSILYGAYLKHPYRTTSSMSKYFPLKNSIPKLLRSNIVYKIECNDCEATYIGKTIR